MATQPATPKPCTCGAPDGKHLARCRAPRTETCEHKTFGTPDCTDAAVESDCGLSLCKFHLDIQRRVNSRRSQSAARAMRSHTYYNQRG